MKDKKPQKSKQKSRQKPDVAKQQAEAAQEAVADWVPKTALGKKVKAGEIKNIDEILDNGLIILEPEIVDSLVKLEMDLLLIGQAKGKFGGGQRRVFRQTQKKTKEGNKPQFTTMAVVGDKDGHIGVGLGKAKETVPAREKAIRQAKLNIFKIRRGSGSWESTASEPHSIPFAVEGKCGSVRVHLMPAPKGKGLVCEKEVAKVLALAGIKDIWSKCFGQAKNKVNLIKALEDTLKKLMLTKLHANPELQVYESVGKAEKAEPEKEESTGDES
ncbi:30S ribosomal protein S5 [Nanoarchaeota archaeon]